MVICEVSQLGKLCSSIWLGVTDFKSKMELEVHFFPYPQQNRQLGGKNTKEPSAVTPKLFSMKNHMTNQNTNYLYYNFQHKNQTFFPLRSQSCGCVYEFLISLKNWLCKKMIVVEHYSCGIGLVHKTEPTIIIKRQREGYQEQNRTAKGLLSIYQRNLICQKYFCTMDEHFKNSPHDEIEKLQH